jgi:LacI family transcriptional regulator
LADLAEFPDVFICANDFIAADAIYTLRKLGKSVPGDVLFCGFDDSPNSRIMTPMLTTVHIHTQIMAYSAAQLIVSRLKEPDLDFRQVSTQTDLIIRASTMRR